MAKSLIITEKPSVAQEFARILGVSGRNDGYIENDKYVIENGINGFVYNANKNDELKHHIIWFKNNMDKISEMSKCARETSLRYSWDIYQKNVSKAILECIKEKRILRS